jgi:PhnB protein
VAEAGVAVPPGFTRLFPYLFADEPDELLDFLVRGLGGTVTSESRGADGSLGNAQVVFGDTTIMVSLARGEWTATKGTFYLYVADADAAMDRATAAGATVRMPAADMSYGDRQGGIEDPAGNVWWLSQRLADGEY